MILKKYIQYIQYAASKPYLLAILMTIFLLSSYPIFNIHPDSNGQGWLPKNSQQLIRKNQFIKDFGSDEVMMLYLTFPDTCTSQYRLNRIQKLNDTISKSLYGFENIFSRYNISEITEVTGKNYANKIGHLYFNSIDSSGEMIYLTVRGNKDIITTRPILMDSLNLILKSVLTTDVKINLNGQSIVFNEINKLSSDDSGKLFAVCFLLVFLLLWWQVKKISYLLICLALVLMALIPSVSLFGWLDIPFNMITMTVPLLFVINFSSFAIHIITKQSSNLEAYINKKAPPIICSGLATIIGFGSLTTSNIKLISQFGLLTSLGIITGLIVMLLVGVPFVIRLIDINKLIIKDNWLNRFLDRYYQRLTNSVSVIALVIISIIIIVGIFIFPKIKTDTNAINLMKPENKVRQSIEYIEKDFGSANFIDFLIVKKDNNPINNDDLKVLADIDKQMATLPFVKSVVGYNVWRPFFDLLSANDAALAKKLRTNFLTSDKLHSKMMINIPSGSVKEMDIMLHSMQEKIDKLLLQTGSKMEINPVGFLPTYVEQMNTIVEGMLNGLVIAVILILIVMILLVRDLKLGLLTIVVTVFPLCGVAIIMKLMDIPFDVGTSIISSVAIGMIADDALHIIWNIKLHLHTQQSKHQPMNILFADSVRRIVYPCTVTSVMFSIGFAVLMYSNMITIVEFGILTATTIVLAWISDFILFPALLKLFYRRSNK